MSQYDEEQDQDAEPTMTAPPEERPTGERREDDPQQAPGDQAAKDDPVEG
ncbi:hypothetical protein [Desertihabitans brevis]|nr:hypothetical protein [Desertihabitans brevis]